MERSITTFLAKREPFSSLSATVLARMAENGRLEEHARGARVWAVGEVARSAVVVRRGVLREGQEGQGERGVSLGLHGRGAVLAVGTLLAGPLRGNARRNSCLEAWEDSLVLHLSKDSLLAAAAVNADFALALGRVTARRAQRLEDRLGAWMHRSASARLAALLLELGDDFGVRDSRGILLPLRLPHRELASLIGVTRETTSLALMALRKAGLVELDGKRLVVVDEAGLRACGVGDEAEARPQGAQALANAQR